MKLTAWKTALIASLLLIPTASRVRASGDPPPPPPKKPKVVVAEPEREIVVDGDRVLVWDDEGAEGDPVADLPDEEHPLVMRFRGHSGGGFIGMRPIEMTPELRQHFGAPKDAGILVGGVEADGPAAKAGIQVGDIVTAADGERVDSTRELLRTIRRKKEGETVKIDLLRDRASKSLTVTVAERKDHGIRLGDLGHEHGFRWKDFDQFRSPEAPFPPLPPNFDVQQRLDDLEQRLKELENRMKK